MCEFTSALFRGQHCSFSGFACLSLVVHSRRTKAFLSILQPVLRSVSFTVFARLSDCPQQKNKSISVHSATSCLTGRRS